MRWTWIHRTFLISAIACGLSLPVFYGGMKWAAYHEVARAKLPKAARNSIQHAYAAAETYAWLRMVGFSEDRSAAAVIRLGYWNEWFENGWRAIDDNTAEIYKDLANNVGGVVAAQWLEPCGFERPRTRLRLIGRLAQVKAVRFSFSDPRIPPLPAMPNVRTAIRAFEADRAVIVSGYKEALDKMKRRCDSAMDDQI